MQETRQKLNGIRTLRENIASWSRIQVDVSCKARYRNEPGDRPVPNGIVSLRADALGIPTLPRIRPGSDTFAPCLPLSDRRPSSVELGQVGTLPLL